MVLQTHESLTRSTIEAVVTRFYLRCFSDGMLSHFFWNLDHDKLVAMQTDFVSSLLGGPPVYRGRPLEPVHRALAIREPHFRRRQQILRETLEEFGLDSDIIETWLGQEEKLKALVVSEDNDGNKLASCDQVSKGNN